jgi:hypothetical protein
MNNTKGDALKSVSRVAGFAVDALTGLADA